jgi:organic radical activating enzyme
VSELTIEITDYCPHACAYCSSNAKQDRTDSRFLSFDRIRNILYGHRYDRIIISGGEPLAHPHFYDILQLCQKYSDDVAVYSNAIKHLVYNQSVIDGVYLEANVTVLPEVDKVHILRRVKQGKEKNRPEVHLSRNFGEDCSCDHRVVRPTGEISISPCNKEAVA